MSNLNGMKKADLIYQLETIRVQRDELAGKSHDLDERLKVTNRRLDRAQADVSAARQNTDAIRNVEQRRRDLLTELIEAQIETVHCESVIPPQVFDNNSNLIEQQTENQSVRFLRRLLELIKRDLDGVPF